MRRRVQELEEELARRGCEAGDYRLTGTGVDHLCCTHLNGVSGGWRVIFGFSESDEIAILAIGRHDERASRNVYDDIYGRLGLSAPPEGRRTKPPCCDAEGEPTVDVEFFDAIRGLTHPG